MKSTQRGFVGIAVIIITLVVGGIYLYKNNQKATEDVFSDTALNDSVTPIEEMQIDLVATFNKPYAEAKQQLTVRGWTVYIPTDFESINDKTFPEIGDCGSGVDTICNVNFKKGDSVTHLNVQIGGQAPYGPYAVWTVTGNE